LSQPTQAAALLAPVGQNSLYLQGTALPTALQQTDLYGQSASMSAAYRNLFAPPPAQPNTIMVSSATSSLMSAAIKPAAQHLYRKSRLDKLLICLLYFYRVMRSYNKLSRYCHDVRLSVCLGVTVWCILARI